MGRRNRRAACREQARYSVSFDWPPLRVVDDPSPLDPSASFEATVTPELAQKLTDATDRRLAGHGSLSAETLKLDEDKVDRFAEKMAAGDWFGRMTLTIDKRDGTLIDGRSRCAAVARSGIPLPARFVEN